MRLLLSGGKNAQYHLEKKINELDGEGTVLIDPSACSTELSYSRKVGKYSDFFSKKGLNVEVLFDSGVSPSKDRVQHLLGSAAMIYVPGGHTPTLLSRWHELNMSAHMKEAVSEDPKKLYSGASAGALAVLASGLVCPAKNPKKEAWEYEVLDGIGLVNATGTVHARNTDGWRRIERELYFLNLPNPRQLTRLSIDDRAALYFENDEITCLSQPGVNGVGDHVRIYSPSDSDRSNPLVAMEPGMTVSAKQYQIQLSS